MYLGCMYVYSNENAIYKFYWLQIHPKKLHKDILSNIYIFLLIIHGDNRYNGVDVHPIGINHIIFKFEITTKIIKPI